MAFSSRLVWSFDVATTGTKNITEVLVGAKSGKIIATEIESPAQQAKEEEEDEKEERGR